MIFLAAATEPTMVLMLTEQDVNDMRGGRTKFVDQRVTKNKMFNKVIVSVHKNQQEIEDDIRKAGHGALLQNMPSMEPKPPEGRCEGCQGVVSETLLYKKHCISCWQEKAEHYRQEWLALAGNKNA
jgi:hypothetical protein